MMRVIALLSIFTGVAASRLRRDGGLRGQREERSWSTTADEFRGPCAQHTQKSLPIHFPLHCTGEAESLTFAATAIGWGSPKLQMEVDGEPMGYRAFPTHRVERTWEVERASLSAGLHMVKFWGERVELRSLRLEGDGAPCSFDLAGSISEAPNTYVGLDVFNRLFGPDRDFSVFKKKQLFFASQTIGKNDDGSIVATAVAEGLWQWMFMYSQNTSLSDPWLSEQASMSEEAQLTPYLSASLDALPGHSGQGMEVCEPCNALSSLAFREAAVWISCTGYSFDRDEYASLMAGLNGLAAGSAFHHTCACRTGSLASSFTMNWLMLQTYQVLVRKVVDLAGGALTDAEKDTLLNMGSSAGKMTDVAKTLTALFRQEYDHAAWSAALTGIDLPSFSVPTAGMLILVTAALEGKWPSGAPGLDAQVESVIDAILNQVDCTHGRSWFEFDGSTQVATGASYEECKALCAAKPGCRKFTSYASGLCYEDPPHATMKTSLANVIACEKSIDTEWFADTYRPAARKAFQAGSMCNDAVMDIVEHTIKFIMTFVDAEVFRGQHQAVPEVVGDMWLWFEELDVEEKVTSDLVSSWDYFNGYRCRGRSAAVTQHQQASHGLMHILRVAEQFLTRVRTTQDACEA